MAKRPTEWFAPSREYRERSRRIWSFGFLYGYGLLAYGLIPILLDLNTRSESWDRNTRLYFWRAYVAVFVILALIYLGYGVVNVLRNIRTSRRDLRGWRSRTGDEESPPRDIS